jgi:hypothetical protein
MKSFAKIGEEKQYYVHFFTIFAKTTILYY